MADPFELFYLPFRPAFDPNGLVVPGATLAFYVSGTTTPQAVYAAADLSVPLQNPVPANAAGKFPPIYIDPAFTYRVRLADRFGATLDEVDPYVPGSVGGPAGDTGPADNTYTTLATFKGSDIARRTASLVGAGIPDGRFNWTAGNYTGQADDVNVIKADSTALTAGAWVRQRSAGLTAKREAVAAIVRTAQAEFNDAVKITQFGALGGDKVKDTVGFNAAVAYAWTRNRAVCIPDSDVPFIFDKIVMPINEQGMDGDTARPTKFTICGTGTVQFAEDGYLFDTTAGRFFYDLTIAGTLRFISTENSGSKFVNGDAFIRLNLTPGLQINKFDWGIYGISYLQSVRAIGVTHRGGKGAFVKAPMAYDCSLTDNIVEFGTDGIVIDGNGDPAVHTCRIDGNVIEGMAGRGIVLGTFYGSTVIGNYMEGNVGGEIFLNAGTAAHKGIIVQANTLQQTSARIASGAYSIVWGATLALPAIAGANTSTGNLHNLTGSAGLLLTFGDYVPSGKNITTPDVGRVIATDDFTLVFKWFDRSMWMDPYQQEVVFKGKFDNQGASPVICFGTNSPSNTPAAFERKAWAKGSVVHNVGASAPGDVSHWICVATGTPGSWRPGGVIPA